MVNMQLMMFLLVAVGFLVRKKNIIGETGRKDMVNFCLYVTLPFNIFHSFQMEWEWSMLKSFAQVLFLATGYCILSIIMSCIFYRKAEPDKRKPASIWNNRFKWRFSRKSCDRRDLWNERIVLCFRVYASGEDRHVECGNILFYERKK